QVGDFVQIEIVGDDGRVELLAQLDQLQVNFAHVGEVGLVNLHVEALVFLNALQNVQPAPPAVALGRIGGISDLLQFAQDELRDQNDAAHKPGLGDVSHAPVNNDAGVQNLEALFGRAVAQDSAERRQVEVIALGRADQQADVGHKQRQR